MTDVDPDYALMQAQREERQRKEEAAYAEFERHCGRMLSIDQGSVFGPEGALPVYKRLAAAEHARQEYRRIGNFRGLSDESIMLAIRIVAATMASEIEASAGDGQDPGTIAWVTAGLRCPRRPFCRGCQACQTVTAPGRELPENLGLGPAPDRAPSPERKAAHDLS